MNISIFLRNAALAYGDRPAISVGDQLQHTYRQLYERATRLSGSIRTKYQLQPGSRVLIAMSNHPAYLEVLLAVWEAGLVAVPVNARLHSREIAYIANDCQVALCFATQDLGSSIHVAFDDASLSVPIVDIGSSQYGELLSGEALTHVSRADSDLAWIFYTSGTTGKPKGAMLSHLNLQVMSLSFLADVDCVNETDTFLHLGPLSHAAGLIALPAIAAAAHQTLPLSGGFNPSEIAALVNHYDRISFFVVPAMVRHLLDNPQIAACKADHIRNLFGGAAPFHASDVKRIIEAFPGRFTNGYGQGECPATISGVPKHMYLSLSYEQLETVGIARRGVEIDIVDQHGLSVRTGEIGEVVVRSPIVMQGYWNNPEATRSTIRDGWLHTGDLGLMDDTGLLYLKDRSKDLIISGGSNVYPREVEDVLLMHPGVAEAAVVGEADAQWGENVVAYIVPKPDASVAIEALDALCLSNIARFKRPKRYIVCQALPRNATGKVLKGALREQLKPASP